jgi:CRISPR/Cas system-associated exonuclease Cas4 (RecB family)
MQIPESINTLSAMIDAAHEAREDRPRSHMGCSMLGEICERKLWLSFRWATPEPFSGRMLRLFRRGHNEEATAVADLRAAGCHVTDTGESQSRVSFGCHVSGSIDGIIKSGVPESPAKPHVLEVKTHSLKSFNELQTKGVQIAKPLHWAQMQTYMLGAKVDRALYYAVCKDDDRIYTERVRLDKESAEALVARGQRIALTERMPEPIAGASPAWYQCKFCPSYDFCHKTKTTTQANCRTCSHSTPKDNGTWHCARWGDSIPREAQHVGCDSHVLHPDLVPWTLAGGSGDWSAIYEIYDGQTGKEVINGEDGYYSSELLANLPLALSGDENVAALREKFGARIC